MRKPLLKYIFCIPLIVAVAGSLLLLAVSFIPTDALWDNTFYSGLELLEEFNDAAEESPRSPAARKPYAQDIYTDSLIIETSYSMGLERDNFLINRIVPGGARPVRLIQLLEGGEDASQSYSRYWMGFRVLIRPLLLFMSYYQIRALCGLAVFLLMVCAVMAVAKRHGACPGFALAAAFCFMEPWAVCSSIQFSCCFILMFLFIIYMSSIRLRLGGKKVLLSFCLLGALIQFFDFYTYPVIVFTVPCLLLAMDYEGEHLGRDIALCFLAWLSAWFVMWLYKQLFAGIISAGAELQATLESVAFRLGFGDFKDGNTSYSVKEAFYKVWYYMSDIPLKTAVIALAAAITGLGLFSLRRRGNGPALCACLALAGLPLLWIAATAQPINIHYWFQYRCTYASIFALMIFAFEALGLVRRTNYTEEKV